MTYEEIITQLNKISKELNVRELSNNCAWAELSEYEWDELCDMAVDLIQKLGGTK